MVRCVRPPAGSNCQHLEAAFEKTCRTLSEERRQCRLHNCWLQSSRRQRAGTAGCWADDSLHCPLSTVHSPQAPRHRTRQPPLRGRETSAAAPVCSLGICRSIVHPARNAVAHVYCSKEPPGTGTGTPCLSHASLAVAICTPGPSRPSFNVKCPRHANWLRTISIISAVVTVFTCCGTLHALFAVTTEMLLSRTF